jgi:hypothetical protein
MYLAIQEKMSKSLPEYQYELIIVDNISTDSTREQLSTICAGDKRVKAIFNNRSYGQFNSSYYTMMLTNGACVVTKLTICQFGATLRGRITISGIRSKMNRKRSHSFSQCDLYAHVDFLYTLFI